MTTLSAAVTAAQLAVEAYIPTAPAGREELMRQLSAVSNMLWQQRESEGAGRWEKLVLDQLKFLAAKLLPPVGYAKMGPGPGTRMFRNVLPGWDGDILCTPGRGIVQLQVGSQRLVLTDDMSVEGLPSFGLKRSHWAALLPYVFMSQLWAPDFYSWRPARHLAAAVSSLGVAQVALATCLESPNVTVAAVRSVLAATTAAHGPAVVATRILWAPETTLLQRAMNSRPAWLCWLLLAAVHGRDLEDLDWSSGRCFAPCMWPLVSYACWFLGHGQKQFGAEEVERDGEWLYFRRVVLAFGLTLNGLLASSSELAEVPSRWGTLWSAARAAYCAQRQ